MSYTPRLTDAGIRNNPMWYSLNPFYINGYGLPNCTCYAWGRWWEINIEGGHNAAPALNTGGNAKNWWPNNISRFEHGQTPKLGAIICFAPSAGSNRNGHVAVVERIVGRTITTSNSDWKGRYFYTEELSPDANGKYHHSVYTSQGFLYNPYVDPTPTPTPSSQEQRHFPWAVALHHWSQFKH